jgi:hypothetical protein
VVDPAPGQLGYGALHASRQSMRVIDVREFKAVTLSFRWAQICDAAVERAADSMCKNEMIRFYPAAARLRMSVCDQAK